MPSFYVKPEVGKTYIDSQCGEIVKILFKTERNQYIGEDDYGQLYKYTEDGSSVFINETVLKKEYETIKFNFYIGLYESGIFGDIHLTKDCVEGESKRIGTKLLKIKHINEEIEL